MNPIYVVLFALAVTLNLIVQFRTNQTTRRAIVELRARIAVLEDNANSGAEKGGR